MKIKIFIIDILKYIFSRKQYLLNKEFVKICQPHVGDYVYFKNRYTKGNGKLRAIEKGYYYLTCNGGLGKTRIKKKEITKIIPSKERLALHNRNNAIINILK
jgi:hypothetical protein